VHSDEIKVSVDGGMATLTGNCRNLDRVVVRLDKGRAQKWCYRVVNRVKVSRAPWWW